eukprot:Blabericola_migrator_1__1944@NODE_152_length_12797_cov_95_608720_g133_i0_p1_GENE_NODE_152_length_12797_cov_95_608720_g133_i0NODE_152_length_12797_cov_95_608720_g133_i0_p1_ORF_typecomplete_len1303_score270_78FbpA/PF05833_11/1_6e78NFACTR_1/PF05670_13/1_8e04NFACTR_1/PF05670_13/1_2e25NFACTC/PF11923_8/2_1e03NFACTC/PF11923_8/3_7e21_NODE_152_length_12797_cov_95_608720_g133_i010634971
MPKLRMSALDVRAMVTDVKPLCMRLRVANIYDISSRVYVLKLSEGEIKRHLVIQAGTRFHLSEWKRDKQAIPSVFTMRLRKYLRTKRLTGFQQLGFDRCIDLKFGHGEQACHLIIEFYVKGNVVLTDYEYIVKASWRQFKADDAFAVKLNEKYPLEQYIKEERFMIPSVQSILFDEADSNLLVALGDALTKEKESLLGSLKGTTLKGRERREKQHCIDSNSMLLVDLVARLSPVANKPIVEYVMRAEDIPVDLRVDFEAYESMVPTVKLLLKGIIDAFMLVSTSEQRDALYSGVAFNADTYMEATSVNEPRATDAPTIKGYLLGHEDAYEDYSPIPFHPDKYTEVSSFHQCVDQFYSSVEVNKAEKARNEKLVEMESKINKIRTDQTERVEALKRERDLCEKQAACVEYNIDFVSRALEMVQKMVNTGNAWDLIEKLIKEQRRQNHPVCSYIQSMDLKNNKFTLLLQDTMYGKNEEEREIEEDAPLIPVPLSIRHSAFQNVKNLHDIKKQSQAKYLRTEEAARKVIEQAEAAAAKLEKTKELNPEARPQIRKLRKTFWFERFYWFISSDGFLVLGGHDAIENEILYKKYLRKSDLFVHADVHGAAACIIRNGSGGPVPQSTIDEAGVFSVCRSNAWKTKILAQAYWVYAYQVSKTPQAGEYVATGGFIIRGQRNPILVKKLEMGLGIFFHLGDDESIRRHLRVDSQDVTSTSGHQSSTVCHSGEKSPAIMLANEQTEESPTAAKQVDLDSGGTDNIQSVPPDDDGSSSDSSADSSEPSVKNSAIWKDDNAGPLFEEEGGDPFSSTREGGGDQSSPFGDSERRQGGSQSRVQFGSSEILPTPAIHQRVEFDELPPEVIVVHSERSILSDDENHWIWRGAEDPDETPEEIGGTTISPQRGRDNTKRARELRVLRRPDSADELPPPSSYMGRAAPRDLLAKRTPETAPISEMSDMSDDEDHLPQRAQTERQVHRWHPDDSPMGITRDSLPVHSKTVSFSGRRERRRAVDGGPPPRGFLEFEVPPVRDLLRFGSRHSAHDEDEEAFHSSEACPEEPPKKKMSKAERKQAKKANKPPTSPSSQPDTPTTTRSKVTKQPAAQIPRGKKQKLKRMKKYEEQSDDEKEIALKLIGSKRMKHEVATASEIVEEKASTYKGPQQPKPTVQEQHPDRNIAEEDSDDEVQDEEWRKRLEVLTHLTGKPYSEDTIIAAIPTCAPYPALRNFTYRGRVLPGGEKKGQAVKHAMQAFIAMSPSGSVERELIRQITSDELSACLVSNPNIQLQGIDKIVKAERQTKKLEKRLKKGGFV